MWTHTHTQYRYMWIERTIDTFVKCHYFAHKPAVIWTSANRIWYSDFKWYNSTVEQQTFKNVFKSHKTDTNTRVHRHKMKWVSELLIPWPCWRLKMFIKHSNRPDQAQLCVDHGQECRRSFDENFLDLHFRKVKSPLPCLFDFFVLFSLFCLFSESSAENSQRMIEGGLLDRVGVIMTFTTFWNWPLSFQETVNWWVV